MLLTFAEISSSLFFRKSIAFLVLVALLSQVFNRAVIVTSYYVNMAAYAKNCENKSRPQMHCNGRCQMMKKMKQEENKEKQNTERRSFQDETLSSKSFYATVYSFPAAASILHHTLYSAYFPQVATAPVFHPPGSGC